MRRTMVCSNYRCTAGCTVTNRRCQLHHKVQHADNLASAHAGDASKVKQSHACLLNVHRTLFIAPAEFDASSGPRPAVQAEHVHSCFMTRLKPCRALQMTEAR